MILPLRSPCSAAVFGLIALTSLATLAGCHQNEAAPSLGNGSPSAGPASGTLVAGQSVYQASGCARCHSLNGQGGRRGPDLSHIGADARHTPQWLAAYVKDPHKVDPGSRMPPFGDRIQAADLTKLGTYLAGLK